MGENFLGFIDAELGIGHGTDEVISGAVDGFLQVDPGIYLSRTDVGQGF